jgi:Tol biopolymer transport system component
MRVYQYPRLSPDGTRTALDIRDAEQDIWIWDLSRQTLTRLTFDPGNDQYPVWTPDSGRVIYTASSGAAGSGPLFWQAADGTGTAERLTDPAPGDFHHATTVTRGGGSCRKEGAAHHSGRGTAGSSSIDRRTAR